MIILPILSSPNLLILLALTIFIYIKTRADDDEPFVSKGIMSRPPSSHLPYTECQLSS